MSKVRYIVTQREVWLHNTEVVADSPEEAITAVEAGEGDELSLVFSHTLGRENTTTKIGKGPSEMLLIARRLINNESQYTASFKEDDDTVLIVDDEDVLLSGHSNRSMGKAPSTIQEL